MAVVLAAVAGLLLGGALAMWRGRRSLPLAIVLATAAFVVLWWAAELVKT